MTTTGLMNLGDTCYMNAVIQCLANTPKISHCEHDTSLVEAWCELEFSLKHKDDPVDPTELKIEIDKTEKFEGSGAQDALGFLVNLLDELPCESQVFRGTAISTLICGTCLKTNDTTNPFTTLNLPIVGAENGIVDLTTLYNKYSDIEEKITYRCDHCCKETDHLKKVGIIDPPKHLIISLKRFTPSLRKVNTSVEFPLYGFTLLDHYDNPYKLYAVIEHSGSYSGGHYVATIWNKKDKVWRIYNDSMFSDIILSVSKLSKDCYILFYTEDTDF